MCWKGWDFEPMEKDRRLSHMASNLIIHAYVMKPSINYEHPIQSELPLLVIVCILNPQKNSGTFPDLALYASSFGWFWFVYTFVCNKTIILSVVLSWVLGVNLENWSWGNTRSLLICSQLIKSENGLWTPELAAGIWREGNVVEGCTFNLWCLSPLCVVSVKSHFNLSQEVIMRIKWCSICDMLRIVTGMQEMLC